MNRQQALERYRSLPVPDTTQEPWMFTDLKGFDPDSFGHAQGSDPFPQPAAADSTILDIAVAGVARVSEGGIEIERAPEGVRFEPLGEHELLGTLVGADDKFSAHNLASWKHGLLVVVPKGLVLEQPLYVKVENTVEGGSLFWRLLVICEEGARATVIEEYASAAPDLSSYSNAAVELFVGPGAKLEYVSIQSLSRETWHFAAHHARV